MKGRVLHTSSAWALKEIDLTFSRRKGSDLRDAVRRLEASEKRLYLEFGKSNYDDFIGLLRELFNENDVLVISRFRPDYLEPVLAKFAHGRADLYNQEIKLILHLDKAEGYRVRQEATARESIINREKAKNKKGEFEVDININDFNSITQEITLTYNHTNVKTVLNAFFKGHNFKSDREIMSNVDSMIDQLVAKNAIEVKLKNEQTQDYTDNFIFSSIPNFPWGLSKKTYTDALARGEDDEMVEEIKRAVNRIKEFVINELGEGASLDLRNAIITTWEANFKDKENNPALFFSGGKTDNFISGVQGALGEFQTALIFTFLQRKLGRNSKYSKIIGNTYKLADGSSEQIKTDVQIMKGLGLQVKNVSIIKDELGNDTFVRDLSTSIHPDKLEKQLAEGKKFVEYIANYFFNITFQKETQSTFNQMILMLEGYLGEVMNMAINKNIDDNISFYLISGKYLVPASKILRAMNQLGLKKNLEVTSAYVGMTDEEYNYTFYQDKKANRLSPNYIEYWKRNKSAPDGWLPKQKNKTVFNQLISSRISIKTHFNILQQIERYALLA